MARLGDSVSGAPGLANFAKHGVFFSHMHQNPVKCGLVLESEPMELEQFGLLTRP
jgi:hypothetical protein